MFTQWSNGEVVDQAFLFCDEASWAPGSQCLVQIASTTAAGSFWEECRAHFFADKDHFVCLSRPSDMARFFSSVTFE